MKVLVLVDVQNDFVYGPLGSFSAQCIIPRMKNRVKEYADGDTLILFTKDTHGEDYEKLLRDAAFQLNIAKSILRVGVW